MAGGPLIAQGCPYVGQCVKVFMYISCTDADGNRLSDTFRTPDQCVTEAPGMLVGQDKQLVVSMCVQSTFQVFLQAPADNDFLFTHCFFYDISSAKVMKKPSFIKDFITFVTI